MNTLLHIALRSLLVLWFATLPAWAVVSIAPPTRTFTKDGGGGSILTSGSGTWTASTTAAWLSACEKPESVKSLLKQDQVSTQDRTAHVLSEQERSVHVLGTLVTEYERPAATATAGHNDAKMSALIRALRLQVEKLPGETDMPEAGKIWRARAIRIFHTNDGGVNGIMTEASSH